MNITFWGVYESDYPRNRIFIEGLKQNKDINVNILHVPVFEKTTDKSGDFLSASSLFSLAIKLKLAYFRLICQYIKIRKKTDLWICGYIGQVDVIILSMLKKIFRDKRPLLFNPLVSMHDTLINDRKKFAEKSFIARILHKIDRMAFSRSDHIIIDTIAHKQFLCKNYDIAPEKVSVVWVGAEVAFFRPRVKMPRITQKPFIVQFIGKFIPLHGIEVILDAAKWFKKEDVIFEIIGSGQLDDWFKSAVKERNLYNIRHIPWVPYDELAEKMRTAHISLGIFNSTEKALRVIPNKVFQALALGRITITAQSKGLAELQSKGIPIIAVKPESGGDLARMIQMVKDGYGDMEGFARQVKKLSKESFSPDILTGQFKEICRKLIVGETLLPVEKTVDSESMGKDEEKPDTASTRDEYRATKTELKDEEENPLPTRETGNVPENSDKSFAMDNDIQEKEVNSAEGEKKAKKTGPKAPLKSAKKEPQVKKTSATKKQKKSSKPAPGKKVSAAKKPAPKKTTKSKKNQKKK